MGPLNAAEFAGTKANSHKMPLALFKIKSDCVATVFPLESIRPEPGFGLTTRVPPGLNFGLPAKRTSTAFAEGL